MIDVKVELERPIAEPHPLYTVTIEDKDVMYGLFKKDGMRASEVEDFYKEMYTKLKDARNHARWLLTNK